MAFTVNVQEAKTHFSRLLEQTHAGQEIILAKAGKPYARLVPLASESPRRGPGRRAGRVGDAFFEPLPAEELDAWEIGTKQRLGKLAEVPEAAGRFAELVAADGIVQLP